MGKALDLSGQRFGWLTVVALAGSAPRRWRCACDCGGEAVVPANALRCRNTQSCGCMHRESIAAIGRASLTHGHTKDGGASPTFVSWKGMMQRAHAGSCKDAEHYLRRGITVCERWLDFSTFLADMGERPAGMTLDRIDGGKGYNPANCRWATAVEQGRNRRTAFRITALGRTQLLVEWSLETGVSHQAIRHRLRAGWTADDAVSIPLGQRNRWNFPSPHRTGES